jgi:hypothetical protein
MPSVISLIPDQMNEINLRISERVKVLNKDWQQGKEKFFTVQQEGAMDPDRENQTHNQVQSLMYTIKLEMLKEQVDKQEKVKLEKEGTTAEKVLKKEEEKISIHNDCGIAGADIALRPKYQLFASMIYLVNF